MNASRLDQYYEIMTAEKAANSANALRFRNALLFDKIVFSDRKVLDIGGGKGVYSFYAASCGASRVVCLEPEADGSHNGARQVSEVIKRALSLNTVELLNDTIQNYESDEQFDIILSNASINHFDEADCIDLQKNPECQRQYRMIFDKIYQLAKPGAHVIVADCSSKNFFPAVGLPHPINRSIEWEKHQPPEIWASLMVDSGFEQPEIKWLSYSKLGWIGRMLLANRYGAYFCASQFRICVRKPLN